MAGAAGLQNRDPWWMIILWNIGSGGEGRRLREVRDLGNSRVYSIRADEPVMRFVVYKGSVALDGGTFFCSAVAYSHELLVFESAVNGTGEITMTFFDGKMFVIKGAFYEQDEETGAPGKNLGEPFEFTGRFYEGEMTYDLEFQTLGPGKSRAVSEDTIKELIKGSRDLWMIPSTGMVRMNKNPRELRLYGISREPKELRSSR